MSFHLHLYDSGIGSRTGLKVSIRNENPVRTRSGIASLSFLSHVNTVLLSAELQEGESAKKPEEAHFGLKLDPVSCKHTLKEKKHVVFNREPNILC